jgi:putative endonuclease
MTRERTFGDAGEALAAQHLESKGLRILERGFTTTRGEVDLIAKDGDTWVFVEVKARESFDRWAPYAADAITPAKQQRIIRAAVTYLKKNRLEGEAVRFDVVTLENGSLDWIQQAFDVPPRFVL